MNSPITALLRPAVCVTLSLWAITPGWAVEKQFLSGHVPAATARLQPVGRMPASSQLRLTIGLPLRNQEALDGLLEQLYNPASPQYRHYLTPDQFAERFGPAREDYHAVIAFAKSQHLAVTARHPNRTLLEVSGSVADIEKAFHVKMLVYQHPTEARTFHAPEVEPSLDLPTRVLHISGLDDFSQPSSLARIKGGARPSSGAAISASAHGLGNPNGLPPPDAPAPGDGSAPGKPLAGTGPGGSLLGNDFRAAYVPGVALTGTGQTLALVEFDGYYASDITNYESLAGLPNVPLQNVLLTGAPPDGTPFGNWEFEVALDIEVAIAMAPGLSQVIVYEIAWNDGAGRNPILNQIATDNSASQISASWTMNFDASTDQIFQQYAAQGQSCLWAAGDWEAEPSGWVADDPYITTVGGTELNTSGPGGAWLAETVWNPGYSIGDYDSWGSGGGISPTYSIPSWQQGLSMAANQGSTLRLNRPDVAMVADNVWVLHGNGRSGNFDGTSIAAPLWAGFTALANQLAQAQGQPPVGFLNPAIYALGQEANYNNLFHDITVGNNISSSGTGNGFFAVPGYDLCTGWGSPAGTNLLYALALPQLLQITPATNITASGPPGGPFSPTAQSYSLTNAGAAPLNWALAYEASWLDASTSNGTLAPGAPPTNVTLGLNSDATNQQAGNYTAAVWFTNLNDGSAQSRLFTLAVVRPPSILTGPTNQTVPDGGTATFTVVADTNALLFYSWTQNTTALTDNGRINGSATSTLTISNVSSADAGTYTVYVTNAAGQAQSVATLVTVLSPPVIVTPPTNQTMLSGAAAILAVGAVGTQPLTYQWRSHGTNLANGANTTGVTSNVLTLRNVSPANAGTYAVIVSNGFSGSVTNADGALAVIPVAVPWVTMATVYSFTDSNDGANPAARLVQASDGNFYGTATSGGASRNGTVFKVTPAGALTTLHTFSGGNDGALPLGELVQGTDGNLYGTTRNGGAYASSGGGTVFKISLNGGSFTTLHAFNGNLPDGAQPYAGLVQATDGNFYGTSTSYGQAWGTIFKITSGGAFTFLHGCIDSTDGAFPFGRLVQGNDGNLYGTTRNGRAYDDGTVFKITPTGRFTVLSQFNGTNGYSCRSGLVKGTDGNFYGTACYGGAYSDGTVFRITKAGVLTVLHSFTGGSDGAYPVAALLQGRDGYFYGTTFNGGVINDEVLTGPQAGWGVGGYGTVFRMSPSGALTVLLSFDGFNGANPTAPLTQASDGTFYGTALNGGANGFGSIFRLNVPTPSLSLALSAAPNPITVGSNLVYSLIVSNSGPTVAASVTVTDTLPAGVTFVSASPGCTFTGSSVVCNLGTMASNSATALTTVVTPTSTGSITNTATLSGASPEAMPANNPVTQVTTVGSPLLVSSPTDKTVECGSAWIFDSPVVISSCTGSSTLVVLNTVTNGACPQTLMRVWQISDPCGNTNTCSQTVSIVDTTPPVIQCPSNIVVLSWTNLALPFTVTATDLCSSAMVVCNPPSGSQFLFNTTNTVHCVATDGCGNSSSRDFTIVIQRPSDLGNLHLAFDGTNIRVTWASPGILQQSDSLLGPWRDVAGSPLSPYSFAPDPSAPPAFYRLRSN